MKSIRNNCKSLLITITLFLILICIPNTINEVSNSPNFNLHSASESLEVKVDIDEFQANYYDSRGQSEPVVCVLSEDLFAIIWRSWEQDGTSYGVYARVFDGATGLNSTPEFRVNDNTIGSEWGHAACALNNETFMVVWHSGQGDGNLEVYGRVFNATTGEPTTSEYRVNPLRANDQWFPQICALSENKVVVAWQSKEQDSGDGSEEHGIYAIVIDPTDGSTITSEFRLNDYSTGDQTTVSICALSEDSFAAAWMSGQPEDSGGIYGSIFNANTGTNTTDEILVNHHTSELQENPAICTLSEDLVMVVWQSEQQDPGDINTDYGIYGTVFNANTGENVTSEFRVNDYVTDTQENPSICALTDEIVCVAWQSYLQDSDSWGVYSTFINVTTTQNITAEFRVNDYVLNDQRESSVAKISEDTIAVAWQSYLQGADQHEVYGKTFFINNPPKHYGIPPDDVSYLFGSTGNTIEWNFTDNTVFLQNYTIYNESVPVPGHTDAWWESGTPTTINIDGLAPGEYNFTIILDDGEGERARDEVTVTVTNDAPIHYGSIPDDIFYPYGYTGNEIEWNFTDDSTLNPTYTIYNDSVAVSGHIDQSWTSGTPITINVDGLTIAEYNFTIVVEDGLGLQIQDQVNVTVTTESPFHYGPTPDDFSYTYGSTGNEIEWNFTDTTVFNPTYTIYNDSVAVSGHIDEPWTSGTPITINVDGLFLGEYNFTIIVKDGLGEQTQDQVNVTVSNDPPVHDGSTPPDIGYTVGTSGNTIDWTFIDDSVLNPTYTIYNEGSPIVAHTDVSWTSNVPITVNIDGLASGVFNFTIVVKDGLGGQIQDQVDVTVVVNELPTHVGSYPEDISYTEGETGNTIQWTFSDDTVLNPIYTIYVDSVALTGEIDQAWTSEATITMNVDGLSVGEHNVTIVIFDGFGGRVQDEVTVTVEASEPERRIPGYPLVIVLSITIVMIFSTAHRVRKRIKAKNLKI